RLDEEQEILARLQRGQRIESFETIRQTRDGQQIHVFLTISPISDAEGRVVASPKQHFILPNGNARKKPCAKSTPATRPSSNPPSMPSSSSITKADFSNSTPPPKRCLGSVVRRSSANPCLNGSCRNGFGRGIIKDSRSISTPERGRPFGNELNFPLCAPTGRSFRPNWRSYPSPVQTLPASP